MGGPIELRLLTLQPFALGELPATTDELVREARAILDSPMWTGEKHWERGVETHSLPPGATTVTHRPSGEVEVDKTPGRRSRFFGGGKTHPSEADDSPSVAWHRRRSTALASEVGFEHYFRTLALSHTEQEAQYVETLAKIVKVPGSEDSYLKLYDLPWPTQNRSFISHVLVVPCLPTERLRSFLVFSLPIVPTERMGEEDGHVRGRYVAVEEVREIEVEEGGVTVLKIQWTCASRSTPGGASRPSLPRVTCESSFL